jgi:uncharacterized radical SAM superfamily Fe-S cluster-containing enzyme
MAGKIYGVCETCRKSVPAEHLIRDGKVFLRKHCPKCGQGERLISSNAAVWQWKREVYQYDADAPCACTLDCETCSQDHRPRLVFLDLTNRCNLNCPICIANIPGMGFEYNPPLSYFERILNELGTWNPKPRVELFGGEPTLRDDLFEIIAAARRNRLSVSVVTNGLRLADEEFCKRLCETSADFLIAFDGRDPETYARMRGSRASYYTKLKALDNVKKHTTRRHTLVCTLARGLNDVHMKDFLEFAHENRSFIRRLFFIPLTEMWEEGEYKAEAVTTPEDVEMILQDLFPGESLEFIPAGLFGYALPALRLFGTERIRFAGVHPNCESATFLVSDGRRYVPLNHYLKRPMSELAADVVTRAKKINPLLQRLDRTRFLHRWRGRLLALRTFLPVAWRAVDLGKTMRGNRLLGILRLMGGLAMGKSLDDLLRKYTNIESGVALTVLPFEEWHSLDSTRLERCSAGFAYLDPDTDALKTTPFCVWCLYRKDMFKKIVARYQSAPQRQASVGTAPAR